MRTQLQHIVTSSKDARHDTDEHGVSPLLTIHFCTLRLFFSARSGGEIDGFIGPEVRGSLGKQLKAHMECNEDHNADCERCLPEVKRECPYARFYVHEGPERKGLVLRLDATCRSRRNRFRKGDTFHMDLVLFGEQIAVTSHLLGALHRQPLRLGERGLAFDLLEGGFLDEKGTFLPLAVAREIPVRALRLDPGHESGSETPQQRVAVTFQTPTEITITHKKHVKNPQDLTFKLFVWRVLDRVDSLARDHCGWIADLPLRKSPLGCSLLDRANTVTSLNHDARWKPVAIRNGPDRKTGGLLGTVIFEGDLGPFRCVLEAASRLGIGKGTTAGFGQMTYMEL